MRRENGNKGVIPTRLRQDLSTELLVVTPVREIGVSPLGCYAETVNHTGK